MRAALLVGHAPENQLLESVIVSGRAAFLSVASCGDDGGATRAGGWPGQGRCPFDHDGSCQVPGLVAGRRRSLPAVTGPGPGRT
jgi:hypothetical protein